MPAAAPQAPQAPAEFAHSPRPAVHALVPCAGVGERAGAAGPKQYARLRGRPLVAHTLEALLAVPAIQQVLVVLAPQDSTFEAAVGARLAARVKVLRVGGATRAASVAAGLEALAQAPGAAAADWVLVHDAARCLLQPPWVQRLLDACADDPVGGLLALPVADTLKRADAQDRAAATLPRAGLWAAQTPQCFRLGLLRRALAQAGAAVTDEASAVEALGLAPRLVRGDARNLKITWPEDFALAEQLLSAPPPQPATPVLRIGEGWDTHALVAGRPLVLGGVTIPHSHGLLGHSDADALLHAITDALLGAAALGDIGRHFPDTDSRFKGADSAALLAEAHQRVRAAGFQLVNLDATVVAQAPRLAPHIEAMRARIAQVLGCTAAQVNVKAKTAEKMGPVGEGRAIEARAVCLLQALA